MAKPTKKKEESPASAVPVATAAATDQYIAELEAELGDALVVPRGRPDAVAQANLDKMLFKMKQLLEEVEETDKVAQLRMDEIRAWADRVNRSRRSQIDYLTLILNDAAAAMEFAGARKSLALPFGVLGRRAGQRKIVVIDKEKVIKFCEENNVPIKVEKSVYLNELKAWSASHGNALPPGCEESAATDDPYFRVE